MLCAFALMAAAGVAYYLLCIAENKRRDARFGAVQNTVQAGLEAEKSDLTDRENTNFRYTF